MRVIHGAVEWIHAPRRLVIDEILARGAFGVRLFPNESNLRQLRAIDRVASLTAYESHTYL